MCKRWCAQKYGPGGLESSLAPAQDEAILQGGEDDLLEDDPPVETEERDVVWDLLSDGWIMGNINIYKALQEEEATYGPH